MVRFKLSHGSIQTISWFDSNCLKQWIELQDRLIQIIRSSASNYATVAIELRNCPLWIAGLFSLNNDEKPSMRAKEPPKVRAIQVELHAEEQNDFFKYTSTTVVSMSLSLQIAPSDTPFFLWIILTFALISSVVICWKISTFAVA